MNLFFAYFLVSCSSLTIVNGISTYYMDTLCGSTIDIGGSYSWFSIRVKLTNRNWYKPGLRCVLTLSTASQYKLMFFFKNMGIRCNDDWLEIHNGGTTHSPNVPGLPGKRCGHYAPSGSYHTTANMLTLYFWSDSTWGGKGFDMVITRYHTGSCYSYEYPCSNGRCIDSDLVCNGYNPCGDYSDCPLAAAAIVGIVIGSLCFVAFVTVLILCRWRRRRRLAQTRLVATTTTTSYGTPGVGYNQAVPQQYPAPALYPTGYQPPPPYQK